MSCIFLLEWRYLPPWRTSPIPCLCATSPHRAFVLQYLSVYMSKAAPAANSASAGTAQTWFKVYEQAPTYANGQLTFPSTCMSPSRSPGCLMLTGPLPQSCNTAQTSFTFPLPKSLPSGQYLVRVEQIALHVASSYGGAQFYISCAQVNVANGGSGTPGPLVSIPGVYTGVSGLVRNMSSVGTDVW